MFFTRLLRILVFACIICAAFLYLCSINHSYPAPASYLVLAVVPAFIPTFHHSQARKMKSHDDLVRYRAALRMRHLAMKQNTHGTNPITGEATPFSPPPPRPAVYQPSSSSASSSSSAFGRRSSAAAESANTYTNTSNDSNASSSNSSSNSRSNSLSGPSIGTRNNRGGGVASALGFGGSFDPT